MVYDNVCWWAKKRGLSIHQLEQKAIVGNGVISRWKTQYNPSMKNLKKIADALGVSVNTLLKERSDAR